MFDVALVWDLNENEEVDFLESPDSFAGQDYQVTGYKHFTSGQFVMADQSLTIFAAVCKNQQSLW